MSSLNSLPFAVATRVDVSLFSMRFHILNRLDTA